MRHGLLYVLVASSNTDSRTASERLSKWLSFVRWRYARDGLEGLDALEE